VAGFNSGQVALEVDSCTYLQPPTYTFWTGSLTVADLNGDGRPDLLSLSCTAARLLTALGNGDGTFRSLAPYRAPGADSGQVAIAVGDLNGDGIPDVVVRCFTGVSVLLGVGDGTLRPLAYYPGYPLASYFPADQVVLADFNRDGKLDMATAPMLAWGDRLLVALGNGDGTFSPPSAHDVTGYGPFDIATGDLTGDGIPDIAVLGWRTVAVLVGTGTGAFLAPEVLSIPGNPHPDPEYGRIRLGDLNRDGFPDIVCLNPGNNSVLVDTTSNLTVFFGGPGGNFDPGTTYHIYSTEHGDYEQCMTITELNRDGYLDVVATSAAGLAVLTGRREKALNAPVYLDAAGYGALDVVSGDFDADSLRDLALSNDVVCILRNASFVQGIHPVTVPPPSKPPTALRFAIGQNPFRGRLALSFELPKAGRVQVAVFDVAGRRLATLADGSFQAGDHQLAWDGRVGSGARAASGVYFIRLQAGGKQLVRRVVMLN
jgi:hypothetical protein